MSKVKGRRHLGTFSRGQLYLDKGRHLGAFCEVGQHVCLLLTLSVNALLQGFEHGGALGLLLYTSQAAMLLAVWLNLLLTGFRMLPISHHVWASYRISLPIALPKLKVESGCVLHLHSSRLRNS